MNQTLKSVRSLAAVILTFGALVGGANGALTVTNFTITSSTASFSISGSVDPGFAPGAGAPGRVLVGSASPFDNWILTNATLISESNGVGATSILAYANTSGFNPSAFGSDWFRFASSTGSWSGGELIDYTGSFSGSFDPSQLPQSVLVTQGYNDSDQVIGTGPVAGTGPVVVPEPSFALLLGLGSLGLLFRRSRC